ncbi:MAG: thioredoxin family protein [Mycoplasma sp.]|nr:thioredoxin family protein [Mycoplasma sp.]
MKTEFITPEQIADKLSSDKKTVIAVAATWCGPCNMMTDMVWNPINEEKGDIQVFKINADDHKEWAKEQGVSGLPTMFIYDGETKLEKTISGFLPREEFEAQVKKG